MSPSARPPRYRSHTAEETSGGRLTAEAELRAVPNAPGPLRLVEPSGPDPRPLARVTPLEPRRRADRVAFDSTDPEDLPPPEAATIQKLALYAFEVQEGARSASQLGQWLLPGALAQLVERRSKRVEQRTLCRDTRRINAVPGPVHLDRPAPDVAEAAVVLHAAPRSTPVALRFEHLRGRWRVTELTVL
ncbi:hypothetical protein D3248_02640 [Leucobacter zeae]|nr:hypothetical protein [Leucobacter zeae]